MEDPDRVLIWTFAYVHAMNDAAIFEKSATCGALSNMFVTYHAIMSDGKVEQKYAAGGSILGRFDCSNEVIENFI